MRRDELITLYDYHCWANRRVLDAAERCTSEQLTAAGPAPHGTLLSTLLHALAAERVWLQRVRDGRTPRNLPEIEGLETIEALRRVWEAQEAEMRAYLTGLSDDDLDRSARYTLERAWRDDVRWHALMYVILHGVQHRSEAAMLLTEFGQSPGNLDFILYVWDKGRSGA